MRIALMGYGRMGHAVEHAAIRAGHTVVARLANPVETSGLTDADVVIEFTRPEAAVDNIRRAARAGVPIVVGTTGWYDDLATARAIVEQHGTALVWGPNFSIGAQVLSHLAREAASRFEHFPDFDPYVFDHHHRGKRDTPSGTARRLAEILVAGLTRKTSIATDSTTTPPDPAAVPVASLRAGSAFGHHRVGFDGPDESLEIVHTAHSRAGFAGGAVFAAAWIGERRGTYAFSEVFDHLMGGGTAHD